MSRLAHPAHNWLLARLADAQDGSLPPSATRAIVRRVILLRRACEQRRVKRFEAQFRRRATRRADEGEETR